MAGSMAYTIKPFGCDPTRIKGLSEKLLISHYENNYGGAVNRLNAINAQFDELDLAQAPGFVINGLKREELIASNSMILHELYFASLGEESAPEGNWLTPSTVILEASTAGAPNSLPWVKLKAGLGVGAAHLVAARPQAHQSVGNGPHDDARRRQPDPGARYV